MLANVLPPLVKTEPVFELPETNTATTARPTTAMSIETTAVMK